MGTKMCRISARTTLVFDPKVDIPDFLVLFLKKVFPNGGTLAQLGPMGPPWAPWAPWGPWGPWAHGPHGPQGPPGGPWGPPGVPWGPPGVPWGPLGPLGPWPCGPVRGSREAIYTCSITSSRDETSGMSSECIFLISETFTEFCQSCRKP